jgi:hypothetical protein
MELICTKCITTKHESHAFASLTSEGRKSHKLLMAAVLPTVREFASVAEARDRCKRMLSELKESKVAAMCEVDTIFRSLQRAVVVRQGEVKCGVEKAYEHKVTLLQTCFQQLDDQHSHTQEGLALVKRLLDGASEVELLGVRETLVVGLDKLKQHGLALASPCTSEIEVGRTGAFNAALKSISTVGAVNTAELAAHASRN